MSFAATETKTVRTPAPGLALIRRPKFEKTEGGGRIELLDGTTEMWTQGQAEVVCLGPPALPDDPDDYDGDLNPDGTIPIDPLLKEGSWVLTRFRTWVSTDVEGEYLIRVEDIIGVFRAE